MEDSPKSRGATPTKGANWGAVTQLVMIPVALVVMVVFEIWSQRQPADPPKTTAATSPARLAPTPADAGDADGADAGGDAR